MRQQPRRPVNERSVLALRSKALRRIRTRRTNDVEGKSKPPPGRIGRALETTKLMFTRGYWSDRFAKTDEVKLVDFNVLLYAYGLAGMIETVFLLLSYFVIFNYRGFSPADLVRAQKDGSFFSKDSPDFVTSSGLTINGRDQFDIWCRALMNCWRSLTARRGAGPFVPGRLLPACVDANLERADLSFRSFQRLCRHVRFAVCALTVRSQSQDPSAVWSPHRLQQVELPRSVRGRGSGYLHRCAVASAGSI